MEWKNRADVVIIGGGILGVATAYYLAKFGRKDRHGAIPFPWVGLTPDEWEAGARAAVCWVPVFNRTWTGSALDGTAKFVDE